MRGRPVTFADFRGGLNLQSSPYELGDSEARDLLNVQAHTRGAIHKRNGSTQHATPGVQLTSLYGASAVDFLIAAGGTQLFAIDGAGVTTALIGALTGGLRWDFVEAPVSASQGPVFGMNGTEAAETDGTGAGTGAWTAGTGVLPIGKYLAYHGNVVWVAGMVTFAAALDPLSALAWSSPGAPRDWPPENIVMFDPGDGDSLQGIGPVGAQLVVFKSDKSWIVYDLETGANRPLSDVGCVSHRSIVATQHGTYFLSRDQGVMVTDGSSVKRISDRVLSLIQAIPASQRQNAVGSFFNGHYYLSISQGGANALTLDYDIELDAWFVHSLAVADMTTWEIGSQLELYGARAASSPVDRLFVPNSFDDAGAAFASYWRGPFHTFGTPFRRKRVHEIHFDGTGQIAVNAYLDFARGAVALEDVNFTETGDLFGGAGLFGGEGIFGGEAEVQEAIILNPGVARAWSIELANSSTNDFEVDSYTFLLRDRTG